MPRVVVGLDISYTNTGVAVFRDGVYEPDLSFTFGTTPKMGTDVNRADIIAKRVTRHIQELALQNNVAPKVFIEDYAFARLTNREKMGEITGIVKHTLYEQHIAWETLPISTIRKVVTGKGNAKKELVMLELHKRHGIYISQNDLADAAAVAITGDFVIRQREDKAANAAWMLEVREAVTSYLKANP